MVKRHLTLQYNFICFTEDPTGLLPEIQIRELPSSNLSGWWYKPYFFKEDLFPKNDTNLFMDLDVVIINNINKLFEYNPSEFIGMQDPSRSFRTNANLNSSVMRWISGNHSDTWNKLENNQSISRNYKGDQDYIWDMNKNKITYYPKKWILSYKWEVRNRSELTNERPRRFTSVRNPEIDPETCILVFHGHPKVHMVSDSVIVENWV